ncbi:MAG: HlyD family efflux transporter periplasmic adaptor subunit [Proteobacteria bacterium]|nr:HlyD family efflux transporter periplasmic adaptor subunit [Pseudomonadota bacterium]
MKRFLPLIIVGALVVLGGLAWAFWPKSHSRTLSGYVDGDLLYLSAPVSGSVTDLKVRKGDRVAAGAGLFQIDPRPAAAEAEQAKAALVAAEAAARDAEKGQRAPELAVIAAQRDEAEAKLRQARAEFERVRILAAKGVYAPAKLDQARADFQTVQSQTIEFERRLKVAELAQRPDQIAAARARAQQAAGGSAEADVRLSQLSPTAPVEARVQDVFFQRGEWAPANQPVLALLPDERVRIRFYVPERQLSLYKPGRRVAFACDGCAKGLGASIVFVSPTAEFTPPVIYSRESREKLVFLVEATPDHPRDLTPGLPVDVTPLAEGR